MWCKSLEVLNPYEALKEANMTDLKPCPFCHEDREGYFKMIGAFFISNPFHRGEYYMNGGKMKPRKINFCPMCGRSLYAGEEDKHENLD